MATLPRVLSILVAAAAVLFGIATAAADTCPAGTSPRMTLVNGCADDVWVVETPPGNPQQLATQGQWAWFDAYATVRNTIPIGLGTIAATTKDFTWKSGAVPNPLPVTGAAVEIPGAGTAGAALVTSIVTADATKATLADAAVTAVTDATMMLYDGKVALRLAKGATQTFCVPNAGAPGGNFHFAMSCPDGDTQPFSMLDGGCVVGPQGGDVSGSRTLFEPTFGCDPASATCAFNPADPSSACQKTPGPTTCSALGSTDYFDVSAVDGYDVPMLLAATPKEGGRCSRPTTDASMLDLASCPTEGDATLFSSDAAQQAVIAKGVSLLTETATAMRACVAPYKWFQTGALGTPPNPSPSSGACSTIDSACFYAGAGCDNAKPVVACPGGSGPQQRVGPTGNGNYGIQNTAWVQQLFETGYGGYTWQYGDGVGTQTCSWGSDLTVTLCPNGGSPWRKAQLWTFDAATGRCATDGSTGPANGTTTFNSLVACQRAHMRYTCVDLTPGDPFNVPAAMWTADADATRAGKGLPWQQFMAKRRIEDQTLRRKIPAGGNGFDGGTLSLPMKNFFYGTTPCPVSHVTPSPHPAAFKGRGQATAVGTGGAGTLTLTGKLTLPRAVNTATVKLAVWHLLSPAASRTELVRGDGGAEFVPRAFAALPGNKPGQLVFASAGDDKPTLRMTVQNLTPKRGKTRFTLSIDAATITPPPSCAEGGTTAMLTTLFGFEDGGDPPVVVEATLPWRCQGTTLVTRPAGPPHGAPRRR